MSGTIGAAALAALELERWLAWFLWTPIGETLSQDGNGVPFLTLGPWLGVRGGVLVQPVVLLYFALPFINQHPELLRGIVSHGGIAPGHPGLLCT